MRITSQRRFAGGVPGPSYPATMGSEARVRALRAAYAVIAASAALMPARDFAPVKR